MRSTLDRLELPIVFRCFRCRESYRYYGGRSEVGRGLKKAQRERRTIVFIDESGLSQRPHRCRTWSPRGQTPVLQYSFNWKKLSAVAGITWWNFYFQLHGGSIRSPQVVEFLRHLKRHIKKRLLVIWDRSKTHRSRLVQQFVASQKGSICLQYLPAYAPELIPWSTSGGTANTMSFLTSVLRHSPN